MMTPAIELDAFTATAQDEGPAPAPAPPPAPFGFVTAERLIGLGIVANALFWCGLLVPFNANSK